MNEQRTHVTIPEQGHRSEAVGPEPEELRPAPVDIEQLARMVYQLMLEDLAIGRQRMGWRGY